MYTFNVGLNVGSTEPLGQLARTLRFVAQYDVKDLAIGRSHWDGAPERFVQFRADTLRAHRVARQLAIDLQQDAVSFNIPNDPDWILCYVDGRVTVGGTVADFPIILGDRPNAADARAESETAAERESLGKVDPIGHSSIQPWSAGPLFPAVIARTEYYGAHGQGRDNPAVSYRLQIGTFTEVYATREDAEAVARFACQGGKINPEAYAKLLRTRHAVA